jgi:hypothetical protein
VAADERTPAVTANTATDREMGFERGVVVGYLDLAIDALSHLKTRTSAGRAWLVGDDQLEEALSWLTALRGDVLRKEKTDSRPPKPVPLPEAVPWLRGANIRD